MTYAEKKAALAARPAEKTRWTILVAGMSLNLLYAIYTIIRYFITSPDSGSLFDGLGMFLIGFLLLGFAINAWIVWGIFRMERWVTMWLWIALILSLLGFNFVGVILSVIALWLYKSVLSVVYPKSVIPPQAPAA